MKLAAILLVVLIGATVTFAEAKFTVTVDSNGVARDYAVCSVEIATDNAIRSEYLKRIAGEVRSTLTDPSGATVVSQLTPVGDRANPSAVVVRWVATNVGKDEKRTYTLSIARGPGESPMGFTFNNTAEGGRICMLGERPVWQHWTPVYDRANHVETYKHFHHVFGFHGEGHITKGSGGQYTHHRGLFLGFSKTKAPSGGYDFWHCSNNVSVRHDKYVAGEEFVGPVAAQSVSLANWCDKDAKPIVIEKRTIDTWNVGEGLTLMDFHFTLTAGEAAGGDIELNGDPQHAGFQFRPRDSVGKTHSTYIRPASSVDAKGDVWKSTPWCVNQFSIEDRPYVVMHMDNPENPGTKEEKTVYSTRNYGRFGAFAPHTLKASEPLQFDYRVLIIDPTVHKELSVEHFDALYAGWVKPVSVTVK